jgi:hypothetical protein
VAGIIFRIAPVLVATTKLGARGPTRYIPRTRLCLLKGCEKRFRPKQASQRYCGEACRGAARKWARWKAQKKYRRTPRGREKRNAQSHRYRERVKKRTEQVSAAARVIPKNLFFDGSCDRPGCYVMFIRTRRSPLQRFCSNECKRALERVREREKRWQKQSANEEGQELPITDGKSPTQFAGTIIWPY